MFPQVKEASTHFRSFPLTPPPPPPPRHTCTIMDMQNNVLNRARVIFSQSKKSSLPRGGGGEGVLNSHNYCLGGGGGEGGVNRKDTSFLKWINELSLSLTKVIHSGLNEFAFCRNETNLKLTTNTITFTVFADPKKGL